MTEEQGYNRAMVVTAHPDDAKFSCSGTVAGWCAAGWEVTYVLCTDGSKGTEDRELTSPQLATIRRKEQISAGEVLGLKDVVFLDHPDAYLEPTAGESVLAARVPVSPEVARCGTQSGGSA